MTGGPKRRQSHYASELLHHALRRPGELCDVCCLMELGWSVVLSVAICLGRPARLPRRLSTQFSPSNRWVECHGLCPAEPHQGHSV